MTVPLSQMIREDMEIWAESHMWPFSCYSCQREGSCLPGLSDVSPEELRWQAYQAKMGSGGEAEYLEILRKLNDEVLSVRGELMRVRASNVGTLVSCTGLNSEGGLYRLQWSWDLKMCPY